MYMCIAGTAAPSLLTESAVDLKQSVVARSIRIRGGSAGLQFALVLQQTDPLDTKTRSHRS